MDNGAASAFVYARACALTAKSFTGKNAHSLFSVKSPGELYTLLFNEEVPLVPEKILTKMIEHKARQKFFDEYRKLLDSYSKPEKIFTDLLKFYDYENVKEIGSLLATGNKSRPELAMPFKKGPFRYDRWPDVKKITEKTDISWYDRVFSVDELQNVDNRIDIQYIRELWADAHLVHDESAKDIISLLREENVMRNVVWALRLRVYYNMECSEIKPTLAYEQPHPVKNDAFAKDACAVLEKDLYSYSEWKNWKYADFLNPFQEGSVWSVDPSWVERAWKRDYMKKIERLFHKSPLSPLVMVCFFKLKQNELDYITAVAEGLRLDADQDSVMQSVSLS